MLVNCAFNLIKQIPFRQCQKDNTFFVISCILLLILLFIYKKNLNLQLESKLLKLEKKSINTDSYNTELEEKLNKINTDEIKI